MKLSPAVYRGLLFGGFLCLLLTLGLLGTRAYLHSPSRGLPYSDSFAQSKADEWRALGGTWELMNGTIRNDSDERGAKLLTGSSYWRNYSIEADVYPLGKSGDAGLIIRSGDEQEGVNAYRGYYAGIGTFGHLLILGRADHSWIEVTKDISTPGDVRPFQWYHLKLLAYDCQIAAAVTVLTHSSRASIGIADPDCIRSGRIGLRSYFSGGIWRNVYVRPASHEDLVQMLQGQESKSGFLPNNVTIQDSEFIESHRLLEEEQTKALSNSSTQTIASLRLSSFVTPSRATIRGTVILTAPRLYVEDSTGGLFIPQAKTPPLKVGDEIEATGEIRPGDFSSTMERATIQLLWSRTPVPPVSVTASQASTGKYDATFIEVRARLAGKERGPGDAQILDLEEGPESFRAFLNPGRSDRLFTNLKLDSILRLRGICVVDPTLTHNLTPFVLLLRSNEDLEVIAGPPWWSAGHLVAIVIAILLLALASVFLHHRVENWRLRAILEERGRLAHEMHDTLAQSFAGIGFQLQAIRNELPEGLPKMDQQLELASNLVRHSHEEARRSIAALRPESQESEDVLSGLEHFARHMVEGGSVQILAEREGEQRPVPSRISDTLYRIGQEAVANAIRHASPTQLTIRLASSENSVCLQVEDNGTGFVPVSGLQGFGIRGMRMRAQRISASFRLQSKVNEGTQITVEAPLPPRVTLLSWPKLLWKYVMEHSINARATKQANSYTYRR